MKKVALVTGATSGIGQQIAIQLAAKGYQVLGGARHLENADDLASQGVMTHQLDVTDHDSVTGFVDFAIQQFGRIDVLVNSAGYGSFGALEEVALDEARRQLDVNVLGVMDLIKAVNPMMRQQHAGKIVNISSLAGQSYGLLGGWYYISKHALETMSDVLRVELKQFGIDVIIVEPGVTATNWASVTKQKMAKATPADSPYKAVAGKQAAMISKATQTVEQVASTTLKAIAAKRPRSRYTVRWQEGLLLKLARMSSYKLQDKFAAQMFK